MVSASERKGQVHSPQAVCWALAHLRKGASRLMLFQKLDGFRLGSASTNTCCGGRLAGNDGCLWRARYPGLPTAGQGRETQGSQGWKTKGPVGGFCHRSSIEGFATQDWLPKGLTTTYKIPGYH